MPFQSLFPESIFILSSSAMETYAFSEIMKDVKLLNYRKEIQRKKDNGISLSDDEVEDLVRLNGIMHLAQNQFEDQFPRITDDLILYLCDVGLSFDDIKMMVMTCKRFMFLFTKNTKADPLFERIVRKKWECIKQEIICQRNPAAFADEQSVVQTPLKFEDVIGYLPEIYPKINNYYEKCNFLDLDMSLTIDGTLMMIGNRDEYGLTGLGITVAGGNVNVGIFWRNCLAHGKIFGYDGFVRCGFFVYNSSNKPRRFVDNVGTLVKSNITYAGKFNGCDFRNGTISGSNWSITGNFNSERNSNLHCMYPDHDILYLFGNCVLRVPKEDFLVNLSFGESLYNMFTIEKILCSIAPSIVGYYTMGLCRMFHSNPSKNIPTFMFLGGEYLYCLHCIRNCVEPYPIDDTGCLTSIMRLFTECACAECTGRRNYKCKKCSRMDDVLCDDCIKDLSQLTLKKRKITIVKK